MLMLQQHSSLFHFDYCSGNRRLPALADTKVDFAKQIQPIFEKSCVKCHGPEKQKGGLRLDRKSSRAKRRQRCSRNRSR